MTTRIAVIGTGFTPTGGNAPPREIAAVANGRYRPELIETTLSVFPGTPYERGLTALGYIEAGIRAQDEGYGAVFINTFGDYGIAELKSALSIPVVGAGEASMSMAATLGRKFAIVTIWPTSLNFIFQERLTTCGMTERCAGVFNVLANDEMAQRGSGDDPVVAMRSAKATMIERIVSVAQNAITQHGADTIILGCTCMAPIGGLIAKRLNVPVVEPLATGYAATETQLMLGLSQSKAAFASPSPEKLQLARQMVAGGAVPKPEECEPCAIASAAE
jgi:allantoin racemase